MGKVALFGSGDYAMRIWLDPQKVAERNLNASDIVKAIREQNVQIAAGLIGQGPGSAADSQLTDNSRGRLTTVEGFGNIVVKASLDGTATLLKDGARIELGSNSYALHSLLDNPSGSATTGF